MHYTIPGALPIALLILDGLLLLFLRYEVANPPQWSARWRGYKTSSSLRNPQTWQEANTYAYRWLGRLIKSTLVLQLGVLLFTSLDTALAFTAGYILWWAASASYPLRNGICIAYSPLMGYAEQIDCLISLLNPLIFE